MEIEYNKLTASTEKSLRRNDFDGGSIVTFKILKKPTITRDMKGNEVVVYPRSVRVPNTDVIFDPNKKGSDKRVNLGYIESIDRNTGNPRFGEIEFLGAKMGAITLSTRRPSDVELINYLRSSNYNKSNPLAEQPEGGFKFEELKPVLTAKQKLKAKKQRAEAENMILNMTKAQSVTYLKSLKQKTYGSVEENIMALTDYIQTPENLARFFSLSTDTKLPVAELVSDAKRHNIVRYDNATDSWNYVNTGKVITQVAPGQDETEHFVEYLFSDSRGQKVREYLEAELNKNKADDELANATVELED